MSAEWLGGAILGSFWWISGAAAALAVCLRLLDGLSSERRYWLVVAFLLAAPVLFVFELRSGSGFAGVAAGPLAGADTPGGGSGEMFDGAAWTRAVGLAWVCGVVLLSLRVVGGWAYLRLLIRRSKVHAVPVLAELAQRLGLRRPVQVRVSARVDSPFAAGLWRPVIVLPAAVLAGLPADQLEAILLHELAHIRRYDYVVEWFLQGVETMFFYHPAVWWMAAVARKERERTCDDMAIASGVDRGCYAKALLELEELRVPAPATGWASDLRGRVHHVLGRRPRTAVWPALLLLTVTALAPLAPLAFAQVPKPYSLWLDEDVFYIIQPEERRAFVSLRTDEEREKFIEQFWTRRDPTPATAENEAKEEHYRRIKYSNDRFKETGKPGWATEKGRTYIRFGAPDEIESHPAKGYEQWLYKEIPGVGTKVIFEFGKR